MRKRLFYLLLLTMTSSAFAADLSLVSNQELTKELGRRLSSGLRGYTVASCGERKVFVDKTSVIADQLVLEHVDYETGEKTTSTVGIQGPKTYCTAIVKELQPFIQDSQLKQYELTLVTGFKWAPTSIDGFYTTTVILNADRSVVVNDRVLIRTSAVERNHWNGDPVSYLKAKEL